jgi:UDP-N-acetylmuramoyl-L-alanyl-D-glutamate--2,6-diaminopimelate ligase
VNQSFTQFPGTIKIPYVTLVAWANHQQNQSQHSGSPHTTIADILNTAFPTSKPLYVYIVLDSQTLQRIATDTHASTVQQLYIYPIPYGKNFNGYTQSVRLGISILYIADATLWRNHAHLWDSDTCVWTTQNIPTTTTSINHPVIDSLLAYAYPPNTVSPPNQLMNIAITGTNGKTSVCHILTHAWQAMHHKPVLSMGTLGCFLGDRSFPNSHITMPAYPYLVSYTQLANTPTPKLHTTTNIMEATSHSLQQNRLGDTQISIAIFTNLSQDHLDYHGTIEAYKQAKLLLFTKYIAPNGILIFFMDDPHSQWFVESTHAYHTRKGGGNHLRWVCVSNIYDSVSAWQQANPQTNQPSHQTVAKPTPESVWLDSVEWMYAPLAVSNYQGSTGHIYWEQQCYPLETPLLGVFQWYNTCLAAACLLAYGATPAEAHALLLQTPFIPGRMELFRVPQNNHIKPQLYEKPLVFIDYAHSPHALELLLGGIPSLENQGNIWLVFGCGGNRDTAKRPMMGTIAKTWQDGAPSKRHIYITSDNPRLEDPLDILCDIDPNKQFVWEIDRQLCIHRVLANASPDDVVIIAGKGHETTQEIQGYKKPFSDYQCVVEFYIKNKF